MEEPSGKRWRCLKCWVRMWGEDCQQGSIFSSTLHFPSELCHWCCCQVCQAWHPSQPALNRNSRLSLGLQQFPDAKIHPSPKPRGDLGARPSQWQDRCLMLGLRHLNTPTFVRVLLSPSLHDVFSSLPSWHLWCTFLLHCSLTGMSTWMGHLSCVATGESCTSLLLLCQGTVLQY